MKVVVMDSSTSIYVNCREEVKHFCKKYDVSRPTVHEAMRDAEQLDNIFASCPVSLVHQCRLVTAVANHPCFVPENKLNAEVQVNSLLPYLSSPCCWVRSLACSLTRVFAHNNMQESSEYLRRITHRCKLCQAISCSGLCFIATSCAQYLPVNAIKFVLLALKTVLKIVGNPSKCSNAFVYQVALDGLAKLLTNPSTWNVLSVLERQDTVETYLTIFLNQCLVDDIVVDDPTTAMMLEVFDNSNVLDILLSSPRQAILGKLLKQLLRLLPPITSSDVPPLLEIRWKSLSIIHRLHKLRNKDISYLDGLYHRGCCDPSQVKRVHATLTESFTEIAL
ncbi:hypothetical protein P5673_002946 [Acropora cervicornis]|uniref:Uncharacterized protein n=1 Tax=Acropora cervicornis TaxID=6130 RepID=A0AAD9R1X4_ACRCE|nr:hypothetical protein P5673_002946 [Acropora cervicornis]